MNILHAKTLSLPGIAHGFFGRTGGVSEGIYTSLNCGTGSSDAQGAVLENRRRIADALGGGRLVTLYQVHSADAVTVSEPWDVAGNPKADAMVTDRPGLVLGILTADCAPILLADAEARIIGAAHAGWKGAITGVAEGAIAAMEGLGARRSRIRAAIGPCIGQAAYEVGAEFEARFRESEAANARFFTASTRDGHFQFDLTAYVAHRLAEAGIGGVEELGVSTYEREAEFFSFRRTTHRKEPDYGRQISAITLA